MSHAVEGAAGSMTEFMSHWREGESPANAWREAQLTLLRSKDFSNPFFWSAYPHRTVEMKLRARWKWSIGK